LNNGHFGPVRFITSVEIARNQTQPYFNINQAEKDLYKETNLYRTIAISGGEGYEEYKTTSNNCNGFTLNNVTNIFNANQPLNPQTDNQYTTYNNLNNMSSNYTSACNSPTTSNGSPGTLLQSQTSFNSVNLNPVPTSSNDDSFLGKDDLINYVLAWEI
jgi:hypothetical protein